MAIDRRLRHIRFRGCDLLLIGWEYGPMARPEEYAGGYDSYAHLYRDGRIQRYGVQIGSREDIEFGGEALVPIIEPGALARLLGFDRD